MFRLFGNKQTGVLTGIVAGKGGTAIASVKRHSRAKPELQACNFSADDDGATDSAESALGTSRLTPDVRFDLAVGVNLISYPIDPDLTPLPGKGISGLRTTPIADRHLAPGPV